MHASLLINRLPKATWKKAALQQTAFSKNILWLVNSYREIPILAA